MSDHQFHALAWTFGPFGRQDVHLHPCIEHSRCAVELVGRTQRCAGRGSFHVAMELHAGSPWSSKAHEGELLPGESAVTTTGRVLTEQDLDDLAAEAERGYDVPFVAEQRDRAIAVAAALEDELAPLRDAASWVVELYDNPDTELDTGGMAAAVEMLRACLRGPQDDGPTLKREEQHA